MNTSALLKEKELRSNFTYRPCAKEAILRKLRTFVPQDSMIRRDKVL